MDYKNFKTVILFRIFFIILIIFAILLTFQYHYYITSLILSVLLILQIYLLFNYISKINRDLTNFFQSIRFSDFSKTFVTQNKNKSLSQLYEAINEVISEFHGSGMKKKNNINTLILFFKTLISESSPLNRMVRLN